MDLIEALRNPLLVTDERFEIAKQAANEIERLRAEVALWKDRHDSLLADAQRMERSFDEAWHRENG